MSSTAAEPSGPEGVALTTGWEPEAGLAVSDTVVRQYLHHVAAYYAACAVTHGGWVHGHDEIAIASCGKPASFFNSAVLLQPIAEDDWDAVLSCVDGVYRHDGIDEYYLWSAWPTPDLRDRGWRIESHPPLMARHGAGPVPPAPDGVDIRRVADPDALHDWERVVVEGFPLPELLPFTPGCMLGDSVLDDVRWRLWVGYDAGRPVAIGTQFTSHGFAQFALGVTLPEARGRGFWYGLVRERLLAEPDLVHGGIFSDDSRPGIERLGFLPVTRFTLWERTPAKSPPQPIRPPR